MCHLQHPAQHPDSKEQCTPYLHTQRPKLSGCIGWGDGQCFRSLRVEDGTLTEITDLFIEVVQGGGLTNCSIVLLGSSTSMLQQGSSGYIFEWLTCAKRLVGKWGNLKVCPLIPLWGGTVPGRMHRKLLELGAASGSLYGGDPCGMRATWEALEDQLRSLHNILTTPLPTPDTYTLPFPLHCQVRLRSKIAALKCATLARLRLNPSAVRQKPPSSVFWQQSLTVHLPPEKILLASVKRLTPAVRQRKKAIHSPPPLNLRYLVPVT